MEIGYGLVLIGEVIAMVLLLIGYYHEDRFVAFENRICRSVRNRFVRRKRAKAKKYLAKKGPEKADRAKAYLVKTASANKNHTLSKRSGADPEKGSYSDLNKWFSERDYLDVRPFQVSATEKARDTRKQAFTADLLDQNAMRLIFGGFSDPDAA